MATKFKQNLNITGTINATAFTGDGSSLTGVSGSPITIQDEGSALSTAATTINFVGAGVTASGTGATKTITISGLPTILYQNQIILHDLQHNLLQILKKGN